VAGSSVFIGSATLPGGGVNQTISSTPLAGSGLLPVPFPQAGSTATSPALDAIGDLVAPGVFVGQAIAALPMTAVGDLLAPGVVGSSTGVPVGVGANAYTLVNAAQVGGTTRDAADAAALTTALSNSVSGDSIRLTNNSTSYGAFSTSKSVATGFVRIFAQTLGGPSFSSFTFAAGAQGIDLRGVDITGGGGSGGVTVRGDRCAVRGCLIEGGTAGKGQVTYGPGTSNMTIEGCTIQNPPTGSDCGFFYSDGANGTATPAQFLNFLWNTCNNSNGDFFHLQATRDVVIQGNLMMGTLSTTVHVDGLFQSVDTKRVVIDRNVCGHAAGSAGENNGNCHIAYGYASGVTGTDYSPEDFIITNNLGFRAGNFGIALDACLGYCYVFHNTVYDIKASPFIALNFHVDRTQHSSSTARFANLQLANNVSEVLAMDNSSGGTDFVVNLNSNNFAPTYLKRGQNSGSTSPQPMTNRITGAPGFAGTRTVGTKNEYKLASTSQLRNAGLPIASLPSIVQPYLAYDLEGTPRDVTTPDVGCYEYV
jgi:hypothetical protein